MKKSVLKSNKRVKVLALYLALIALGSAGLSSCNKIDLPHETTQEQENVANVREYRNLHQLQNVKMEIIDQSFKEDDGSRKIYGTVSEQDVLDLSWEFSMAIEDYFKSKGASNWTRDDEAQFWPEDIEYIVTAIAFRETTYRTNTSNKNGCAGLLGIKMSSLLETLNGWANNKIIWGNDYPYINCDLNQVDVFNPTTSIEYTYYNIGFNLANRFKKEKIFPDKDGQRKCIWDTIPYSEELQIRLVIASHKYGMDNVVDAVYGRQKDGYDLNHYINSGYVNDILEKTKQLKNVYENSSDYGY